MVSAQCFTALKLMMMVSIYHFCAILVVVARACPYPCFLAEVVLRGEIFFYEHMPDDITHLFPALVSSFPAGAPRSAPSTPTSGPMPNLPFEEEKPPSHGIPPPAAAAAATTAAAAAAAAVAATAAATTTS